MQNENKLAVESSKMMLSSIKINSVIYVPMLTKVYDIEEARSYDNFTNE